MAAVVADAHATGAVLLASAGGSSESPYGAIDASAYGRSAALWANTNLLDGVDFNLENVLPGFIGGK